MYVRICRSKSCRFWKVGSPRQVRRPSITENSELTNPPVKVEAAAFVKNCVAVVAVELPAQAEPIRAASWVSKKGWGVGGFPPANAAATAADACADDRFEGRSTRNEEAALKVHPC